MNASVSVSAHADMEKPVATLSERRPQRGEGIAHGERGERPTNQVPNIGCQEFSYLDAALGKSQAFPRKFFCRHDGIDTRYRLGSGVKARTIRRIQEAGRNIRRMRCDKKGSIFPTVPYYFIK